MRKFNRITLKILSACIISFLIELTGLGSIAFGLSKIFKYYDTLITEGIANSLSMKEIRKLTSQEQNLSSIYVLSTNDTFLRDYKREEENVRNMLKDELAAFGKKMTGKEKEQIFYNISSSCYNIFSEIDLAMNLRENGSKDIAEKYITQNLVKTYNELNNNIEELWSYIDTEMKRSQAAMIAYKHITHIFFTITVFIILSTLIVFIIICLKLTNKLESHKNNLQSEVQKKTEEIIGQNRRLIYIQEQVILGMANLIEGRDGDTGEHVKRTSLYVELLVNAAREAGYHKELLTPEYVTLLKKAAPMHDIGKISVPDSILKKPDKLTDEEFKIIQNHTISGGKIIREVFSNIETDEYVQIAADVAGSHHERWDGKGYPHQLKGEQIPFGARVMAIADVFDALVSPRCYKDPYPAEEAFEIIKISRGTHFDPVLADLFVKKKFEVLKILSMN